MTSCCGRSLHYLLEHHLIGLFILMLHHLIGLFGRNENVWATGAGGGVPSSSQRAIRHRNPRTQTPAEAEHGRAAASRGVWQGGSAADVITVRLDKNQGRHRNAAGTDDLPPRPSRLLRFHHSIAAALPQPASPHLQPCAANRMTGSEAS
jgi:hypothetical protein